MQMLTHFSLDNGTQFTCVYAEYKENGRYVCTIIEITQRKLKWGVLLSVIFSMNHKFKNQWSKARPLSYGLCTHTVSNKCEKILYAHAEIHFVTLTLKKLDQM